MKPTILLTVKWIQYLKLFPFNKEIYRDISMQLLEYYQNQLPNSDAFISRKCHLPQDKDINLYGVRGSGKTALLLDYLTQYIDISLLYIDMDDPNLIFHSLETRSLQQYIDTNNIQILILDHYVEGSLDRFPNVKQLIVITRIKLVMTHGVPIELFPLDYEEFLAFESTSSKYRGFNHFLRSGTLPLLARSTKNTHQAMKIFFQSSFNAQEQKLLLLLAQHHTKHLTTYQIYTFSKEKFKVSKDWIYKTIKQFKEEKLIIFIENHEPKAGKKMLLFDFAFARYLSIGEPFILQFDTMIALTLTKHHIEVKTLGIHGYITPNKELLIPAPFESEESQWRKSQNKFSLYKQHDIQKITIITVTNSYSFRIELLEFNALPFDEWSISHTEE